jgi:hypothetical protein
MKQLRSMRNGGRGHELHREQFLETLRSQRSSGKNITLATLIGSRTRMFESSTDLLLFSQADLWFVRRHVIVTLCPTRMYTELSCVQQIKFIR